MAELADAIDLGSVTTEEELNRYAPVVELADTLDLGSNVARHAG